MSESIYIVQQSNKMMLTFLTPQDSYDIGLKVGDILKANEHTIWLKQGISWKESITTIEAIEVFLEQGVLKLDVTV